ncbi:MAG: hypothetical protein NVSMB19_05040 [Vulcanimicrobiaceae bacterium]
MNAASYLLAVAVVGSGIFALAPRHVAGAGAAAAGVALATPQASASPAPSDAAAGSPAPAAGPSAGAAVDTQDFRYLPATLRVRPGATVRFTNSDAVAHTVSASDASFDSKNLAEGQSWSHVFATAGTYTYFCAYHRYMHGTIVVQ